MDIQKILRWLVIAIVLCVALALLTFILEVSLQIIQFALPILLVLLLVAIVLRFFEALRNKRRR